MAWFFQKITEVVSAAPPVDKAAQEADRKAALRNQMREQAVALQANRAELVGRHQALLAQYRQKLAQANRNPRSPPAQQAMLIKKELNGIQAEIARIDRDIKNVRNLLTLAQNRERTAQMHRTMQEYARLEQTSGNTIDRDQLGETVQDLQELADQERAVQRDLEQLSFDAPTDDYAFDQDFLADLNDASAAGTEYADELLPAPPSTPTPLSSSAAPPMTEEERLAARLTQISRSNVSWEPPAQWGQ